MIKNIKTEYLPPPMFVPPCAIKTPKMHRDAIRRQSKLDIASQETQSKNEKVQSVKKVKLFNPLEQPPFNNEVMPMGSVFNDIAPTQGTTVTEAGKVKYGV